MDRAAWLGVRRYRRQLPTFSPERADGKFSIGANLVDPVKPTAGATATEEANKRERVRVSFIPASESSSQRLLLVHQRQIAEEPADAASVKMEGTELLLYAFTTVDGRKVGCGPS